ncbi:class I SAM-dependent methyltransferase [soil metagenome]
MYGLSAKYYDAIYSFKDYKKEAAYLIDLIDPSAETLLDVACGSGKHLRSFSGRFRCSGLDLEPQFVESARVANPDCEVFEGSFVDFELGKLFDVVTCLFSAIGYAHENLDRAMAQMAKHLNPGGTVFIEPWFQPGQFYERRLHTSTYEGEGFTIVRMNTTSIVARMSIMDMHHLIGTPDGVTHFVERHELMLYSQEEVVSAFQQAGLAVRFDPVGPTGRGLYIGTAPI